MNTPVKIKFTPRSKHDLRKIFDYTVREFGLVQARLYRDALQEKIHLLLSYPELGIVNYGIGVSCRILQCMEHLVFYRKVGDAIEVIRILHRSMDPQRHLH